MRLFQEYEQERRGIMAVTTVQSAVTFPDVLSTTLEKADRHGQIEFQQDLAVYTEETLLIDDEPLPHDEIRLEDEATA